jgi:hypothetical protein
MAKGIVKVGKTLEGKYYGQVVSLNDEFHQTAHYETPEYLTEEMAQADAKCWKEFHMTDDAKAPAKEYRINEDDRVFEFGGLQNTNRVLDFIGKTLNENPRAEIKYSELGGLLTGYEGFVLHICVGRPGSKEIGTWRRFTVLKANQK